MSRRRPCHTGDIGLDPFYKLVFPTMDMLTQEHQDLLNNACDEGDPKAIKATARSRRPSRVHRTMTWVVSFPISMLRAGRGHPRGPEPPPGRPEDAQRPEEGGTHGRAAQVRGDGALLRRGGADVPRVLYLLFPLGPVYWGCGPAVRAEGRGLVVRLFGGARGGLGADSASVNFKLRRRRRRDAVPP
jgi:hypothetical protein